MRYGQKKGRQKKLSGGELESRILRGGGRLVLVDGSNQLGRKAYQIIFISKGAEHNLLPDPEICDAVEIERDYYEIRHPRDFWKKRTSYFDEYDLRCSGSDRLDDSDFDDWSEDLGRENFADSETFD